MPYSIELTDELFAKLQKHAVPLVDTPLTVIDRALRALEEGDEEAVSTTPSGESRTFNPAAPPDLTFTKPRSVVINGRQLPYTQAYWNAVMFEVIREAGRRGTSTQDILDLITVNSQAGVRRDNGFSYLKEADLSIQGQDSNGAWRQTYLIASSLGISVDVVFRWQNSARAAMPDVVGSFHISGDER
jgi:hypothetical protein